MIKGYIVSVTEYESGWGCRPDGYLICMNKDKGLAFSKKSNGHICGDYTEFSTVDGSFELCIINEKAKQMIEESKHGVIWVNKYTDFVIEK